MLLKHAHEIALPNVRLGERRREERPAQPAQRQRDRNVPIVGNHLANYRNRIASSPLHEFPTIQRFTIAWAKANTAMPSEVLGSSRFTVLLNMGGACDHRETKWWVQADRDHVGIDVRSRSYAGVKTCLDNVD